MGRHFAFLNLPIELRRQIYDYLVPDIEVSSRPLPPFRREGQVCAPALFTVNRAIYHELLEAWYGNKKATYTIHIDKTRIVLLGLPIYPQKRQGIEIPAAVKYIRNLKVHVEIDYFAKKGFHDHIQVQEFIAAVLGKLQPGKCALRMLQLHLGAGLLLFFKAKEKNRLRESLELNTRMLRKMRGLHSVKATFQLEKFDDGARPFLDDLEAEMMSPVMKLA